MSDKWVTAHRTGAATAALRVGNYPPNVRPAGETIACRRYGRLEGPSLARHHLDYETHCFGQGEVLTYRQGLLRPLLLSFLMDTSRLFREF